MKVLIEAPFSLSEDQKAHLEEQVKTGETYSQRISQVDIFFKLDDGNTPNAVLSEIKFHVPGPEIFASDIHEDYLKAFQGALNKATRQLKKSKDIRKDHHS